MRKGREALYLMLKAKREIEKGEKYFGKERRMLSLIICFFL